MRDGTNPNPNMGLQAILKSAQARCIQCKEVYRPISVKLLLCSVRGALLHCGKVLLPLFSWAYIRHYFVENLCESQKNECDRAKTLTVCLNILALGCLPLRALTPAQPQSQGKISLAKVSGTIYMEVRVPLKKVKSVGVCIIII